MSDPDGEVLTFKVARKMNNDLIKILHLISQADPETDFARKFKENLQTQVESQLEKLENSHIVLE